MKMWQGMLGGALLLAGMAGCVKTELAQTEVGSIEAEWQKTFKENYSGWRAPRVAPPGVRDNMDSEYKKQKTAPEVAPSNAVPPAEQDPDGFSAPEVKAEAKTEEKAPSPAVESVGVIEEKPLPAGKPVIIEPVKELAAEEAAAANATEFSEYVVQSGDSLSLIARKVYGDGRKYHRIFKANEKELNNNPNRLKPGMKLRIPLEQKAPAVVTAPVVEEKAPAPVVAPVVELKEPAPEVVAVPTVAAVEEKAPAPVGTPSISVTEDKTPAVTPAVKTSPAPSAPLAPAPAL